MRSFPVPLYKNTLQVFTDRGEFARFRRNHTDCPVNLEEADGICSYYGHFVLIGIFNKRMETISHECAHASMRIIDGAGIEVSLPNSEAVCYLLGWITETVCGEVFGKKSMVKLYKESDQRSGASSPTTI